MDVFHHQYKLNHAYSNSEADKGSIQYPAAVAIVSNKLIMAKLTRPVLGIWRFRSARAGWEDLRGGGNGFNISWRGTYNM